MQHNVKTFQNELIYKSTIIKIANHYELKVIQHNYLLEK